MANPTYLPILNKLLKTLQKKLKKEQKKLKELALNPIERLNQEHRICILKTKINGTETYIKQLESNKNNFKQQSKFAESAINRHLQPKKLGIKQG